MWDPEMVGHIGPEAVAAEAAIAVVVVVVVVVVALIMLMPINVAIAKFIIVSTSEEERYIQQNEKQGKTRSQGEC